MTNTFCCAYSIKTPDDGQQICPKHVEFFTKINLRNSASRWLLLREYIKLSNPDSGMSIATLQEHTTAIFRVDVSALEANPYHMQVMREL